MSGWSGYWSLWILSSEAERTGSGEKHAVWEKRRAREGKS